MRRLRIKCILLLSLLILIVSNASPSMADFIKTLLGEDPKKDADPASVDILKVYIANNGTHFGSIIKCRGSLLIQLQELMLYGWIRREIRIQITVS